MDTLLMPCGRYKVSVSAYVPAAIRMVWLDWRLPTALRRATSVDALMTVPVGCGKGGMLRLLGKVTPPEDESVTTACEVFVVWPPSLSVTLSVTV